jgi:hypothetical protein
MPESSSNRPVTVTAEERAHPAIVKLARACIALVRLAAGSPSAEPSTSIATSGRATDEQAASQERADD